MHLLEVYRALSFVNNRLVFFTADGIDNNVAYAISVENTAVIKATDTRIAIDLLDCPWYNPAQSARIFERIAYDKSPQISFDMECIQREHPFKRK